MIYISTSCIKEKKIFTAVKKLADEGFNNIELSGGTKYYDGYESDLIKLKGEYNLKYLVHNYFPPPHQDFVLNLASLNDKVYNQSITHLERAIQLSKKLQIDRYSFHAGFFLDLDPHEVGKEIKHRKIHNIEDSIERFCLGFNLLKTVAGSTKLYLENNVYSLRNWNLFKDKNLFMLTNYEDYFHLKQKINFELLLDVAHLKVSSGSLNLNFDLQLDKMMLKSDYIHLSENNGTEDQNSRFSENSELLTKLKKYDLRNKVITLEVYEDLKNLKESYELLNELIQNTESKL